MTPRTKLDRRPLIAAASALALGAAIAAPTPVASAASPEKALRKEELPIYKLLQS